MKLHKTSKQSKNLLWYFRNEPSDCITCSTICHYRANGGSWGSITSDNVRDKSRKIGNSHDFQRADSNIQTPICGDQKTSEFTQNGCIYECGKYIRGSWYCTSERDSMCGYCLGTKEGRTTCM